MAIKMRYLYYSGKKKMAAIGEAIKAKYELQINSVDVIPPAYSCDKERVVILAVSCKGGEPSDKLRLFCKELTKLRAQNTCLLMDGDQKSADAIKGYVTEAGSNFIGDIKFINGGGLFNSKPSEAELNDIYAWIDGIIASL